MRGLPLLLALGVLAHASTAAAGGYDIPILYSARHIGAGGTAVADADDSSAIFHNPSGIGQIGKGNLLLNVSLLTGDLRSTPYLFGPQSIQSERVLAPFFLAGGSGRVHEYVTLGLAVYPVAAASGEYKYTEPVDAAIANVFEWSDQWTLRTGAEYRVVDGKLPLRLGFIYDSKTTNFKYPSGFSTPPTHTYTVTAGIGYDHGPWEINVAYARRFGKVLIDDPANPRTPTTEDDSLTREDLIAECPACGYAGDYRFRINGFYVDFSWDWH